MIDVITVSGLLIVVGLGLLAGCVRLFWIDHEEAAEAERRQRLDALMGLSESKPTRAAGSNPRRIG